MRDNRLLCLAGVGGVFTYHTFLGRFSKFFFVATCAPICQILYINKVLLMVDFN